MHVCRRWRQIVFESPRRLDLKIRCTSQTPARRDLRIWPAFPIAIDFGSILFGFISRDAIAALEHTERICYLKLELLVPADLRSKTFTTLTSKPFPVLTHLIIRVPVDDGRLPHLCDDFLGGSAPRLQLIHLHGITFPALQTLLLSASDLVELQLEIAGTDHSISPMTMTMCLANLPRLKTFFLRFIWGLPTYDSKHLPPITRVSLPALTKLEFRGPIYYLEDMVPHIDCPRLNQITISTLNSLFFQFTQLFRFLNRSISPFRHAKVCLGDHCVTFGLHHLTNHTGRDLRPATTVISCSSDQRLFHTLNKFSAILSTVIDLKFVGEFRSRNSSGDDYSLEWLPFFRQFPALQTLYVSLPLAEKLAHAMKSIKGEVVAGALPSLHLICLENQASFIEDFVAVRQLSDCPLTVVHTEAEFDQQLQSYGEKLSN